MECPKTKTRLSTSIANQKRRGIRPEAKNEKCVRKINKSAASLKVIITKSRFFFLSFQLDSLKKPREFLFFTNRKAKLQKTTLRSSEAQSLSALL